MNKVIIVGNLARDPESGVTSNGVTWCRMVVAVNRRYTGQNGQPDADFLTVIAWRGVADSCAKYLAKGRKVSVDGRLETRTYEDADGVKRYVTEIVAGEVEFLTAKGGGAAGEEK